MFSSLLPIFVSIHNKKNPNFNVSYVSNDIDHSNDSSDSRDSSGSGGSSDISNSGEPRQHTNIVMTIVAIITFLTID